ncbi:hypothetical protein STEG23_005399 [Scotinomys teguina]
MSCWELELQKCGHQKSRAPTGADGNEDCWELELQVDIKVRLTGADLEMKTVGSWSCNRAYSTVVNNVASCPDPRLCERQTVKGDGLAYRRQEISRKYMVSFGFGSSSIAQIKGKGIERKQKHQKFS